MGRCKFKLTFVSRFARASMPHMVSFVQDLDDPNVQHEFLVNLGPLGLKKEEEPDTNRAMMQPRLDEECDEFRSVKLNDTYRVRKGLDIWVIPNFAQDVLRGQMSATLAGGVSVCPSCF